MMANNDGAMTGTVCCWEQLTHFFAWVGGAFTLLDSQA